MEAKLLSRYVCILLFLPFLDEISQVLLFHIIYLQERSSPASKRGLLRLKLHEACRIGFKGLSHLYFVGLYIVNPSFRNLAKWTFVTFRSLFHHWFCILFFVFLFFLFLTIIFCTGCTQGCKTNQG